MGTTKDNKEEVADSNVSHDITDSEFESSSVEDEDVSDDNISVNETKTGKGGFALFIAILLSLIALAASGYLYLQQNGQSQQTASTLATLKDSLKTVSTEQTKTRQQLQKTIERQISETQAIKKSIARTFTAPESTQQNWSAEEIHYLLQLAVDQLTFGRNIDNALAALNTADRRIADGGDSDLQAIRQQIAQDIAKLQQTARIDMAGTINRLSAVELAIDQLPTKIQTPIVTQAEPEASNISPKISPVSVWQQIIQELTSLVKIRQIDHPEVPLLPPERHYFLRENSKALILSSRLALLRNDTLIYRNNLRQAGDLMARYFDNASPKTQWILSEIENLATLDLAPPLPDISGSLNSLQTMIEGKQN